MKFKIVIITSGQPSLNPRMVKEADALADAGYEVTVLYAYWNDWGTQLDKQLLSEKKWKAIRLGGDPQQKPVVYFLSRLLYKISRTVLRKTKSYKYFADLAIARSSYFLIKGAKNQKADLYIAHNLGALPAAFKTSLKYKKPCGFDAEDFHRQEVDDNVNSLHFKIAGYIEDKYLPRLNYLTGSSPLISNQYATLYNRKVTTLLNVFPKTGLSITINKNTEARLKLFWFSQTIGPNRGLETVIEAMSLAKNAIELHLLGQPTGGYQQHITQLYQTQGLKSDTLFFYKPVKVDKIPGIASQFDVGLASETGFCFNNNMALSNKIFTYMQSGLAIAASNTPAQGLLLHQYPKAGKTYSNERELAAILDEYGKDRELLHQTKKAAFEIGQNELNWENEGKKFIEIIENVISKYE